MTPPNGRHHHSLGCCAYCVRPRTVLARFSVGQKPCTRMTAEGQKAFEEALYRLRGILRAVGACLVAIKLSEWASLRVVDGSRLRNVRLQPIAYQGRPAVKVPHELDSRLHAIQNRATPHHRSVQRPSQPAVTESFHTRPTHRVSHTHDYGFRHRIVTILLHLHAHSTTVLPRSHFLHTRTQIPSHE